MPIFSVLRLNGRSRLFFVAALVLFVSAGVLVSVDQLRAYHGFSQEIWGYVKNSNGSAASGAQVWYCHDAAATPPSSCTGYSPSQGVSDSMGKWWQGSPAAGYYRVWAVYNCTNIGCESQAPDQTFYYSGSGVMQAPDLVLSSSSPPPPPPPSSGANLFVENYGYSYPSSSGPQVGDVIGFFGDVRNNGSSSAGASMTRFRLDINSDGSWDLNPANAFTGSLAANAFETERWDSVWTAVAGSHKFEICADTAGAVAESNESDNCAVMTFSVGSSSGTSAELYGYVRGSGGVAISGASIKYLWNANAAPTTGTPSFAGSTDNNGRWSFSSPAIGYYHFWAVGPDGSASQYADLYYSSGKIQAPDLFLSGSTSATGTISGYAYNASGQALAGVGVEVRQETGLLAQSALTTSSGSYTISNLSFANYQVLVAPPSGSNLSAPPPQFVSLRADFPNAKLDFWFFSSSGTATIAGRVVDGAGKGIANVWLNGRMPEGTGYVSGQTGSDGTYKLSVSAGTWEIGSFPDPVLGYAFADPPSRRITIETGMTVNDVNFTLMSGDATIAGRIVDGSGAVLTNLSNGWVFVEGKPGGGPVSAGAFRFSVPAGSYTVNVWLPPESGYVSRGSVAVTVASGQIASVDLVVAGTAGGGILEGSILDASGARVTNVGVEVFAGSSDIWIPGKVDSSTGRYTIAVPPGTWQLGFRVLDTRFAAGGPVGGPVVLTAGQTATRDILLVRADATITVTVRKVDGSVFPNVGVEIGSTPFDPNMSFSSSAFQRFEITDAQGTARFGVPAGTYYIRSFAPYEIGFINPPEQSVTVAVGETKSATLTFRSASATISGRVLVNGQVVADAFVGGWSRNGGFAEGRVQSDGTFTLAVAGGDVWYMKAGANVSGVFYESAPVPVDMTTRTSATQDITLVSTNYAIPPPFTKTHTVTEPFSTELQDGMKLSAPANSFGATGTVNVAVEPDITTPDQGAVRIIGAAYQLEARKTDGTLVVQLNDEATVTIPYDPALVSADGVAEIDLRVGFFDETAGRWQALDTSIVDTASNSVTATTTHLTRFALVTSSYASVLAVSIQEGDLVRGPDGIKVYIVNAHGYKRHIFNPAVFGMYGHFKWDQIKEVSQATLDGYATSDTYRADGDAKVYSLEEVNEAAGLATKRWLDMTAERFSQLGYNWNQVFIVNTKERDFYQTGSAIK